MQQYISLIFTPLALKIRNITLLIDTVNSRIIEPIKFHDYYYRFNRSLDRHRRLCHYFVVLEYAQRDFL